MCCLKHDQSEIRAVHSLFSLPLTKQPNLIVNYTDSFFRKYTELSYNFFLQARTANIHLTLSAFSLDFQSIFPSFCVCDCNLNSNMQ